MVTFVKVWSVRTASRLVAVSLVVEESVVVIPGPGIKHCRPIDGDKSRRRKWRRGLVITVRVGYGHGHR